jgi:hypothetical protein
MVLGAKDDEQPHPKKIIGNFNKSAIGVKEGIETAIDDYKKDYPLNENLNFKRGLDSKEALKVGRYANPIELNTIEDEWFDTEDGDMGKLIDHPDRWARVQTGDVNSWHENMEISNIINILSNWPDGVNQFMGAWIKENPGDEWDWVHIKDLEGEVVEYQGELYDIPVTGPWNKETGRIDEAVQFKRGVGSKESMDIGLFKEKNPGDVFWRKKSWRCFLGETRFKIHVWNSRRI